MAGFSFSSRGNKATLLDQIDKNTQIMASAKETLKSMVNAITSDGDFRIHATGYSDEDGMRVSIQIRPVVKAEETAEVPDEGEVEGEPVAAVLPKTASAKAKGIQTSKVVPTAPTTPPATTEVAGETK